MIKLSIITVNLNNREGLRKTIASVVSQTFADFEYLIIDGASTDGSVKVIQQHREKITYWLSEPDHGIYEAMNKGIGRARGEYCLFLNSGDWLVNDNILADVFAQGAEADIISGNVYFYDTAKNQIKWYVCSPEKMTAKTIFYGSIPHQATFIRRELFHTIGLYDESLKIASDWLFFRKALLEKGASYSHFDGAVAYFNMEGISCSPKTSSLPRQEQRAVLEEKFPLFIPDYQQLQLLEEQDKNWQESRERRVYEFLKRCGIIKAGVFLLRAGNFLRRKLTKKLQP